DPEVDVSIDRNGKMNLLTLMPQKDKGNTEEAKGQTSTPKGESGGKESIF
ncbi:MAG: hypothetical protein H6Q84_3159, partial [Deltaproteobacteria bacterium]|nr:hypothetical protein [Deltaproteobacteria bacterium]